MAAAFIDLLRGGNTGKMVVRVRMTPVAVAPEAAPRDQPGPGP
jgi:hypothetical protein